MRTKTLSLHLSTIAMASLIWGAASARAQDVVVSGSLSYTPGTGGLYDYTLTLDNTGSEAVESLWLGWKVGNFNIPSPTSVGNSLGWNNGVDGNSVQFGGTAATAIPSGGSGIFTFDTTATPAQFMAGTSGDSVAYGVNATQFAIENTTLHSFEFQPQVVPEPSTAGLLAVGGAGLLATLRRRIFGH